MSAARFTPGPRAPRSAFAAQVGDVSVGGAEVILLTLPFLSRTGRISVHAGLSGRGEGTAGWAVAFAQLKIDGIKKIGTSLIGYYIGATNWAETQGHLVWQENVGPGLHTLELVCKMVSATGGAYWFRPTTRPDSDHVTLAVVETEPA